MYWPVPEPDRCFKLAFNSFFRRWLFSRGYFDIFLRLEEKIEDECLHDTQSLKKSVAEFLETAEQATRDASYNREQSPTLKFDVYRDWFQKHFFELLHTAREHAAVHSLGVWKDPLCMNTPFKRLLETDAGRRNRRRIPIAAARQSDAILSGSEDFWDSFLDVSKERLKLISVSITIFLFTSSTETDRAFEALGYALAPACTFTRYNDCNAQNHQVECFN